MGNRTGNRPLTFEEVFWPKVKVDEATGCWLWQASLTRGGYPRLAHRGEWLAHRLAYQHLVGTITPGMQLDHLCRVRACVNPKHLEPVTNAENARRGDVGRHNAVKTHCPAGHAYTPANTYVGPHGKGRICRECGRIQSRNARNRVRVRSPR